MMNRYDRIESLLLSRVGEISGNLHIRRSHSFFVKFQSELFRRDGLRSELKHELQRILKAGNASESVAYRGLVLQLYGAFERFIADIAEAALEGAQLKASRFSELSAPLRDAYAVGSARLLTKLHDKTINGLTYNFNDLQLEMGACFSDHNKYRLRGDTFTALLGVCNSEKVDWIFKTLQLGTAFDDALGRDQELKTWSSNAGARETSKRAKDTLNDLVRLRNQIAHGSSDSAVADTQVEEIAKFLLALGKALLCKARLADR